MMPALLLLARKLRESSPNLGSSRPNPHTVQSCRAGFPVSAGNPSAPRPSCSGSTLTGVEDCPQWEACGD